MKDEKILVSIDYDNKNEICSSSVFCSNCNEAIQTLIDLKDKYNNFKITSERINIQVGEVGETFIDISLYNVHNLSIRQKGMIAEIIENTQNQLLDELKKIE